LLLGEASTGFSVQVSLLFLASRKFQ
jgi:hypothetical protein